MTAADRTAGAVFARCALAACALAACAQTAAGPTDDPVWTRPLARVAPGDASLALEIQNDVVSLGTLVGLAAVLDGALVFREANWQPGQRRALAFATDGGRHQLCVVAYYRGATADAPHFVQAPRLIDLVSGSAVTVRVNLEEERGAAPGATARFVGGAPYAAAAGAPDHAKYAARLAEICAGR